MSQNTQTPLALPAPQSKKKSSFFAIKIRNKPHLTFEEKVTGRAIRKMQELIKENYYRAANSFPDLSPDSSYLEDLMDVIKKYALIDAQLSDLLKNAPMAAERARACLQNIRNQITVELGEYPDEHHYMQKKLTGILQITIAADQEIARVQPKPKAQAILSTGKPSLLVPADLLFQIYYSLFPAERMMVISGRRTGDTVVLGAAFDVTGVASGGHVSADPALLARALISMDLSDTYLAAWIHSHPGRGIQATFPSKIDLRQHAEWIQNYSSHLLSAIIVQDRYIRFWGTALEAEDLTLSVQLPGLTQEDGNDHVYRLIN